MTVIQQLLTEHIDIWTAAETEKKSGRGRAAGNAGSVYGIKKLRELILELAVRGKLVAKECDWKKITLGELGAWAVGSGFPTSEQGNVGNEILFAKVSDMNLLGNERFLVSTINTITVDTAKKLKINVHPAGTVVFPKIGGAISTNKRRILIRPTAIDNNCLGLTPNNGISTEWVFLQLSSIDFSKYQAGTSVPALAQGVLQKISVLLPNENEQHRIVAKVEELMALCDQLETQHTDAADAHEKLVSHLLGTLTESQNATDFSANWQRIAAHFDTLFTTESSIDALKQTLLQLAVMGKLVPQDANDEPASELLVRIQAEKARLVTEGKIKKDKPLAPIAEEEKLFDLPQGWDWGRLGNFVENSGAGWSPSCEGHPRTGNDWGVLKVSAVSWGRFLPEENKALPKHLDPRLDCVVEVGDFLVSRANTAELVARSVVVEDCPEHLMLSDKIVRLRLSSYCDSQFINLANLSSFARNYYSAVAGGTSSSMKNVSREQILNLVISLPPLSEQHRIVAKIYELTALCDRLKSRITAASQLQQKLADVLVEHAVA